MIDVIRVGHASSPHGLWIAGWVKEQFLQEHPELDVRLVSVTDSLTDFEVPSAISNALLVTDVVVADGSFVPAIDDDGVVVAAVCERADPRHCLVSDGDAITVWHPSVAAVLRVTDPTTHVTVLPTLIDSKFDADTSNSETQSATIFPSHALARTQGQRLRQTPIEAEDILSACGQGATLLYTKQTDTELGAFVFGVANAMETRREITVERYFKSQLDIGYQNSMCCYAAGSDRFLYLFVTLVIGDISFKTRSGAHISALASIVDQAISDLEAQAGLEIRSKESRRT